MKVEFLTDGSDDCPLIRMYDYTTDEVVRLRQACIDLASGRISEFSLHEQSWVQCVNGCQFVWRSAVQNEGVNLPRDGTHLFILRYNHEAWRELEELLEPFAANHSGTFNWLTYQGEVSVLISHDGSW